MSSMPFKVSPSTYSFEVIKDGLIKTGVASNGYDDFEFIGLESKKITKTETWVGSISFWETKLNEVCTQSLLISSSYVLIGASVDGNYTVFLDGMVGAQGSLVFVKYLKTGGSYTPPPPIINSNANLEILQYTMDGKPIVTNYRGVTETKSYWISGPISGLPSLPTAGTKESSNVLLQSVSISGHKVVNGTLYANVTETRNIY